MAVDVVPPSAPENKAVSAVRGIPSFYQAVDGGDAQGDVAGACRTSVARRSRSSSSCCCSASFIWLLDLVLQQVLVKLIPSLFSGR